MDEANEPHVGPIDVSVVVVSYNTRALTLRCLRSIRERTHLARLETFVVDNASSDGSLEAVREAHPEAAAIALDENVGFGRACNRGAAAARGRYVLLLNPDAELTDGALDTLVELADARPGAGLYGGVTLDEDGTVNHGSCWRAPSPWSAFCQGVGLSAIFPESRWFSPQICRVDASQPVQEVDIVSGGLLLVRRDWWQRLDGFDEAFFLYGEDFDLCLRARAGGAKPCVFPAVRVVHPGGGTDQPEAERLVRLLRAKAMLYERHWSRSAAAAGRASLLLWMLTRRLGYRLAGQRGPAAAAWDDVWRRRRAILEP